MVPSEFNPDGALAEPSDSMPPAGSSRIRLDVAYDGTDFFGWATQPGYRTVQGQIGRASCRERVCESV